jgi:molybdopterin molybdotransferase
MKDPAARMLPIEEALAIVLDASAPLPPEEVRLEEAEGRILAEEVRSDIDQPPVPRAMMDGYALRSADVESAPAELSVVEEIPAGRFPSRRVGPGQASRINTGAPVPEGADAVQMVERTEPGRGPDRVRILEAVPPRANVAAPGSEVRRGQLLLEPGARITPPRLGVLASAGRAKVLVHRRPRALVAPTGDELVDPENPLPPGGIRNSNGPAIVSRLRRLGADAVHAGIVRDERGALAEVVEKGLAGDLLFLSGGVSMGTHDLVEGVLEDRGVEILFRKVAVRPGKPAVFGRRGSSLVFGLPGNPVSSLVILETLAAPAIRRMLGIPNPGGSFLEAILDEKVTQRAGRTSYLPGTIRFEAGSTRVRPVPTTGSADLLAHSRADVLFVVPSDRERVEAGETVRVLLLEGGPGFR